MKTFNVTYTTSTGKNNSILVRAENKENAIRNSKNVRYTGKDFRNAVETTESYRKPKFQH